MAGARVEFTADTASPALKRLAGQLQGAGKEQLLGRFGEYLLTSTRERAKLQVDPDGNKWAALSPPYAREKAKKRPGKPMLNFDFHMLGDRLSYQVDGDGLLVGTSAPYGAAHQFGHTFQRAARTQDVFFSKRGIEQGDNRFRKKRHATFAQTVHVPEHQSVLPPRPFLGVSKEDEVELVDIAKDHLGQAFEGD